MVDHLALKRLTASDLTLFEWHFRNNPAGNQKAINLNADVFFIQFYPSLGDVLRGRETNKLGIDLWIAGPAAAEPVNLQRKIIKGAAYKNWRLDGEFVYNPVNSPGRFNMLGTGDLALIGFEGQVTPDTVTLLLLASAEPLDQPLLAELNNIMGNRRMMALESDRLRGLCDELQIAQAHPVWLLTRDEDLAEAAQGQAPAINRLLRRSRTPRLSLEDLRKARRQAEEIGRLGEELVDYHLQQLKTAGKITDYEWASDINAIAPYDFRVNYDGSWKKLEIKTTGRKFSHEYHLPLSELREIVHGAEEYCIGRVYEVSESGAKMKISTGLRAYGQSIVDAFETLPDGVTPDGVTIVPDETMFGEEIGLAMPADDET